LVEEFEEFGKFESLKFEEFEEFGKFESLKSLKS